MELYVDRSILGEGHFHEVNLAIQRREFEHQILENGFNCLKENILKPSKSWVIKKVKDYNHLAEVPFDIAKQYIALTLSEAFNDLLKE